MWYTMGMKIKEKVMSIEMMYWHVVEDVKSDHHLFQNIVLEFA
jgi:hypothetical protein